MFRLGVGVAGLLLAAGAASAQILPEIEPNETKAQALANGPFILGDGMGITGMTTGTSTTTAGPASADTFLIQNVARPLGIYRHRLVLDSSTFSATIRGVNQIAATAGPWPGPVGSQGTTDTTLQTGFIPTGTTTRINQWYGFGKQEQLYYRVTGTTSTTGSYTAILESQPVTPVNLGTFQAGNIAISTIAQGHTTDTDLWIYDSNLNAIVGYGNDDESTFGGGTGATLQSLLNRQYAPGTYYLALSNFGIANNQGAPSDDDFRTGSLTDFADVLLNTSTSVNLNLSFAVTDSTGTTQYQATKAGQFDVYWASFTVVPAPGSLALIGLGCLLAARRRR